MEENFDRYSLIQNLEFTKKIDESSVNQSPDITSIIAAFEANKNPTNLFFETKTQLNVTSVENRLDDIEGNLNAINEWIQKIFVPVHKQLERTDLNRCMTKFTKIQKRFTDLQLACSKITQQYTKILKMEPSYCCNYCQTTFALHEAVDLDKLELHEHAASILSLGTSLQPILEVTNTLERPELEDELQIISAGEVKDSTNQNYERTNIEMKQYDEKILNALYPRELMTKITQIEKNDQIYSIQAIQNNSIANYYQYRCLLCPNLSLCREENLLLHVSSNKHLLKLTKNRNKLIKYHDTFLKLPVELQMHQVFFVPKFNSASITFECVVCFKKMLESDLINHINDLSHQYSFFKSNYQKFNFYEEIALLFRNMATSEIYTNAATDTINSDNKCDEDNQEIECEPEIGKNEVETDAEELDQQKRMNKLSVAVNTDTEVEETSCSNTENENMSDTSSKSDSIVFDINAPSPSTSHSSHEPVQKLKVISSKSNSVASTSKQQINGINKNKPIEHNIVVSLTNNPILKRDFIEHRFLKYIEFIVIQESHLICSFCKKNINRNKDDLKMHFISEEHRKNANPHFEKLKYTHFCDLCFRYFQTEIKWTEHLGSADHLKRLSIVHKHEPKGGLFKEYECIQCFFVLYGNNRSCQKHLNGDIGIPRRLKAKVVKLPSALQDLMKNEPMLNDTIKKLIEESQDVLNSSEVNVNCCKAIEQALIPVFGENIKAYPFGSRISGLGNLASDLDVFVDTGSMYDGLRCQTPAEQEELVRTTVRALRKHKEFNDIFPIPQARTPIVQVFHKPTGLDCDLSFRHGLSVENTEFLRLCIDIQPMLKALILFLKKWISYNKQKDRLSTYALSMMAIYFMQSRNFLPSLQKLREIDPRESTYIAGWPTFCVRKPLLEIVLMYPYCSLSPRVLLREFFNFYINFNYQTQVVCPLLGRPIPKIDFTESKGIRLPVEMAAYVIKINESYENEVFKITNGLCVQDPFDLSHNLTKAIPLEMLSKMLELFKQSHEILMKRSE